MKIDRQTSIRRIVEENDRVTVPGLSTRFGVSEATIRRDLKELSRLGYVHRTHGGAVRARQAVIERPLLLRIEEHAREKKRIGRHAAALIQDGETIFLGSGTTVLEIARNLPVGIRLTLITNSLPVVNQLAEHPGIELVVIGGMLRQSELSMIGHLAEEAIGEFRADRVFVGMRAIDAHHGFTNDYLPEVRTDRAILKISSEVIVVADHSKFGVASSVLVAPVTAASAIITDQRVDAAIVEALEAMGLQVIKV